MNKQLHILSTFLGLAICLSGFNCFGQNQSILDFTVKELNGDTIQLRDRLDPNANYIIETMAFWCGPCIRSIEKFNYHQNYWKERFNVDILLIEDEHWDDLPYVEAEMEELGWDLDIVISNDQYSSVGINSIPRYFFKGVASDTVERVYGNIEKFLLERVDSIKFSPIFDDNFKQVLIKEDCEDLVTDKYQADIEISVNGNEYRAFNQTLLRESDQNGNVYRFDIFEASEEELYIKYSAPLCSRLWLKDIEGDSLMIKILDRYQEDSILHVVTDQFIYNECSSEEIPFEFIQNVGTNAGFFFNIENGKIVSQLICHKTGGELIYTDGELGNMCLSLSTKPISIEKLNIQIFPNPVSSNFFINLDFEGDKKIEIFSAEGQKLITKNTNSTEVNISLPDEAKSSLYLVKISTKYGVVTKKVLRIED